MLLCVGLASQQEISSDVFSDTSAMPFLYCGQPSNANCGNANIQDPGKGLVVRQAPHVNHWVLFIFCHLEMSYGLLYLEIHPDLSRYTLPIPHFFVTSLSPSKTRSSDFHKPYEPPVNYRKRYKDPCQPYKKQHRSTLPDLHIAHID